MEEGLYYPCSENKGADQLRGYREADLRLCFRICKKPVFSQRGSNCKISYLIIEPGQEKIYFFAYRNAINKGAVQLGRLNKAFLLLATIDTCSLISPKISSF